MLFLEKKLPRKIKNSAYYKLIANPQIYLKVLIYRTLSIGLITLLTSLFVIWLDLEDYTIPTSMHSLIGLVIGLLLVFRTNTAYDRWWEGRKLISSLSSEISIITAKLDSLISVDSYSEIKNDNLKTQLKIFLTDLRDYLSLGEDNQTSMYFHLKQKDSLTQLFKTLNYLDGDNQSKNNINNSLIKIMEHSNQLERIKNTPIPLSYVFHIKISVLIYLLSLPFGMFHDLGLWSVPLVMLIHYIIAGVEIISTEIENPFAGNPNDLPIFKLFNIMIETLKS
jgi:putative membrane protein